MKRWIMWGVAVLLPGSPASSTPQDGVAAVNAVIADFEQAEREFGEQARALTSPEERQRLMLEEQPRRGDYTSRLWPIIEAAPKRPAARRALLWILEGQAPAVDRGRALGVWLEHHLTSERILEVIDRISPTLDTAAFLETLRKADVSREIQGRATYALASALGQLGDLARMGDGIYAFLPEGLEEAGRARMDEWIGAETLAWCRTADLAELDARREALLTLVVEDFADLKAGNSALGDKALADRKELHGLGVGKVAPEIRGEDVDGVPFQLSDYRGKVILLDFWGHW